MTPEDLDRREANYIHATTYDEVFEWTGDNVPALIAALRAAWERERWIPVKERFPECGPIEDGTKGWLVHDKSYHIWYEMTHPHFWNKAYSSITHWREIHGPKEGE